MFKWVKEYVESPFEVNRNNKEEEETAISVGTSGKHDDGEGKKAVTKGKKEVVPTNMVPCFNWVYTGEEDDDSDKSFHSETLSEILEGDEINRRSHELESAEDQLGAVLWNSNTIVLRWMKDNLFHSSSTDCKRCDALGRDSNGGGGADGPLSSSSSRTRETAAEGYLLQGMRIVELGAGVGVLGIALARAGAKVAVTDMKELVPLMHENCCLSRAEIPSNGCGGGSVGAFAWKWGDPYPDYELERCLGLRKDLDDVERAGIPCDPYGVQYPTKPIESGRRHSYKKEIKEKHKKKKNEYKEGEENNNNKTTSPHTVPPINNHHKHAPIDYVIMVDALYGNPKEWPKLIQTLTEIVTYSPACKIVNFCEQRVENHEDAFLTMLKKEKKQQNTTHQQQTWNVSVSTLEQKSNLEMPIRVSIISSTVTQKEEEGSGGRKRQRE